jgi:predicted nucleic acid-binding protein
MRIALDTNVLAYAEGVNGPGRQRDALKVLAQLRGADIVLPAQTLGELFHVLVRKATFSRTAARAAVQNWHDAYAVVETSASVIVEATDLACAHGLSIWDSVVLSASAQSGCRLLLSEDLQDGFLWRGVTVTNPFASTPHPVLAALLAPED